MEVAPAECQERFETGLIDQCRARAGVIAMVAVEVASKQDRRPTEKFVGTGNDLVEEARSSRCIPAPPLGTYTPTM